MSSITARVRTAKQLYFQSRCRPPVGCPRQLRSDARNEDTDSSLERVIRKTTTYLRRIRRKRTKTGSVNIRQLYFSDSRTPPKQSTLRDVLSLNLSPDGRYLLVKYNRESYPAGWANEP